MGENDDQQQEQKQEEQQQDQQQQQEDNNDNNDDNKGDDSGEKKEGGESKAKKMENPDSIPSAGGERLGEKHWGESKIVPDNPKPAEDDKVASEDGQPDDQTKANTKKNQGDGAEGEHKEGFMDKIKEKLGK